MNRCALSLAGSDVLVRPLLQGRLGEHHVRRPGRRGHRPAGKSGRSQEGGSGGVERLSHTWQQVLSDQKHPRHRVFQGQDLRIRGEGLGEVTEEGQAREERGFEGRLPDHTLNGLNLTKQAM